MGQAAVPIALAVASTAATVYNTRRTAKKQDQAIAQGIQRQGEEQRKATARLNETLDFFEKSDSQDERERLASRYADQVRRKQALGLSGLDSPGASSEAFEDSSRAAGERVLSRAGNFADLFARIDAPVEQRLEESAQRGDLGSDLSVFGRNSTAEDYLTRLRLRGIQRNPYLDILAAGLSGASKGTASRGAAAPKTISGSGPVGSIYGVY